MLKPRLLGVFLVAAAPMFTGAEFAVARDVRENDVSVPLEWKNQIIADLEHNKRYLPGTRIRSRGGIVRFEFNMSRAGWVLPGTRIVTVNPELGRAALLLVQQSQPFAPPEHVKLPDASFRVVVPIRFEKTPPREAGLEDAERKLLECYEADRQELEYQRRRAAYSQRGASDHGQSHAGGLSRGKAAGGRASAPAGRTQRERSARRAGGTPTAGG